jgi:hypothetical protein
MNSKSYISIKSFCIAHDVEESFVQILHEYEVLAIEEHNKEQVVSLEAMPTLEKMVRLNKELDINPEGLQAVHLLLKQIQQLQEEVDTLKRKMDVFRND